MSRSSLPVPGGEGAIESLTWTAGLRLLATHARRALERRWWHAPVLFASLAIFHTWPLATKLPSGARIHDDVWLNAWAVSWIARQVSRDPLHLFDANMFHPHREAMAYTEPLVVPGLLAVPIDWVGGSALLAHNVLVLLGLTLTALAVHALVGAWTGDHRAGLLSGALFAFSTVFLTRVAHLQALHAYWLPLAFLAFHRLMQRRRTRDAAWLGACVLGAGLTSGYLVVFVCFALGAAALARAREFLDPGGIRLLGRLVTAAALTLLVLVVVLQPYVQAGHQRPPAAEGTSMAAALGSYLSSAARLHYESWSGSYYRSAPGALFPGIVTLVLAGIGLLHRRTAAPRAARRMLLAVAGTGLVLSLGTLTPVYDWAYHLVPPLRGLRAIHRFGVLVVFALAVLAGVAFSALAKRASARTRTAAMVVLLVLATGESFHGVGSYPRFDHAGPVHRYLAASSWPGAVVELPIYGRNESNRNARYLLASTVHWRPLLNGFGGFVPRDFEATARLAGQFPSVLAVAWLQDMGVGYVVVNTDRYPDPAGLRQALDRLVGRRDLMPEVTDGPTRLYRVRGEKAPAIAALSPAPVFSRLRFVDGPSEGSMLRASSGTRRTFGLQSADRLIAYTESTGPASRVLLRLPVPDVRPPSGRGDRGRPAGTRGSGEHPGRAAGRGAYPAPACGAASRPARRAVVAARRVGARRGAGKLVREGFRPRL